MGELCLLLHLLVVFHEPLIALSELHGLGPQQVDAPQAREAPEEIVHQQEYPAGNGVDLETSEQCRVVRFLLYRIEELTDHETVDVEPEESHVAS